MKTFYRTTILLLLFTTVTFAKSWYTINGNLARVEYQNPNLAVADSILHIAERVLPRLANLHGLPMRQLEKHQVRIILTDAPDISNGMAFGKSVLIYAQSSMYMPGWTGPHPWYETVVTHELAHYVTFLKIRRKFNLFGEAANLSVPRWFYEGVAQYFAENWNTYRGDIYIKNAVLSGQLNYSSLEDINDGRLLYASGHAFIRYLATEYGDSSLIKLMSYEQDEWFYDFDEAFEEVYGKQPDDKYLDFIRHMVLYYGSKLAAVPQNDSFKTLPPIGYQDYQMLPLNEPDSTWLVSSRLDKNHYYKTALILKKEKDKYDVKTVLTDNYTTDIFLSADKRSVAWGRYHFSNQSNQLGVGTDWYVYDLASGRIKTVTKNIRARCAAFNSKNELVLAETLPFQTNLLKFPKEGAIDTLLKTNKSIGNFIVKSDTEIIASVQDENGKRDLYLFKDNESQLLTNDFVDDRNPILLNDSLLIFNRYQDENPGLAVYNFNQDTFKIILNDRYAYFLQNQSFNPNEMVVSRWEAYRQNKFLIVPMDSLSQQPSWNDKSSVSKSFAQWTQKQAQTAETGSNNFSPSEPKYVLFPFFPMEHAVSFALPTYDENYGWGVYGLTTWMEILQRQTLAALFILSEDYKNSFVTVQHTLNIFNGTLASSYYHGPVFFSFENGDYLEIEQDIFNASWIKKYYINGNPRSTLTSALRYSNYNYENIDKNVIAPYSFKGIGITGQFSYLKPTAYYPAFPGKLFSLGFDYFKSLSSTFDFSVYAASISFGSNLLAEEFGFINRFQFIGQTGEMPDKQFIGVDRFYEFDLPRDFIYSRPIRGLRQDIQGNQLLWNSAELVYLIDDYTGLKLIDYPMNNLAISVFLDYATVGNSVKQEIYSYGSELTFGDSFLRMGGGYAESFDPDGEKDKNYYLRISLFMP